MKLVVVFLLLAALASFTSGDVQKKRPNKFLTNLHNMKIDFLKDKLGDKNWGEFQQALSTEFSLSDILTKPISLKDFWPFLLLNEGGTHSPDRHQMKDNQGSHSSIQVERNEERLDDIRINDGTDADVGTIRISVGAKPKLERNETKVVFYEPEEKSFYVQSLSKFLINLVDGDGRSRQSTGIFAAGLAALGQLAEQTIVFFGQSVAEVQQVLEDMGKELMGQNRIPVGVVTPNHYPTNQHYPISSHSKPSDQELLDRLNIALEVMAHDEHFNTDQADAAHMDHLGMEQILHKPLVATESYLDHLGPRAKDKKVKLQRKRKILLRELSLSLKDTHRKRWLSKKLEMLFSKNGGLESVFHPYQYRGRSQIFGFEVSSIAKDFLDFLINPRMAKSAGRRPFKNNTFLNEVLKLKLNSLGYVKASLAGMIENYATPVNSEKIKGFPKSDRDICLLIPQGKDLIHLEKNCFHKTTYYLGPCKREFRTEDDNLCTQKDFENTPLHDNDHIMKFIMNTYFKHPEKDLPHDKLHAYMVEPSVVIGTGSSSWPWHKRYGQVERDCRCLSEKQLFQLSGVKIGFLPCTQPIPWCFVDGNSKCSDAVSYGYEQPTILWSQRACSSHQPVPGPTFF